MCGINGVLSLNKISLAERLNKMNGIIAHRGPDDEGFYIAENDEYNVGLAMRRLAVLDLESGNQPMLSEDRNYVIVFNGEIYNYISLKEDLLSKGYSFETASDTEVVVNLFQQYGTDAFSMLDGMFAISIYDIKRKRVILARDYFGEKPLYYFNNNGIFYWCSELKSILSVIKTKPNVDKSSLNLFLQLTYIPAPHTIYEGIKKLEPNHYLIIDCCKLEYRINEIKHIWKDYSTLHKIDYTKITRELVQESVSSRMIADVPIGAFLSGGVDSSIVALCMSENSYNKIDTFSIGFEKKSFDESEKSRLVSKLINSNHNEFILSENEIKEVLSKILLNFDEPFADSSALASFFVASKTKQKVKVALTGDGGDEVFGGYNKYLMGRINRNYTNFVPRGMHNLLNDLKGTLFNSNEDKRGLMFRINRLLDSVDYDSDFYFKIISLGFQGEELNNLLVNRVFDSGVFEKYRQKVGVSDLNSLSYFRHLDRLLSLEGDMLVKVDRTSMLTSLECRSPFLNKEIWNFTNQIPEKLLINKWDKKYILKESFKDFFPKGFLDKSKKGFGVPVGDWLKNELLHELMSFVDREFINRQGIFNFDYIERLVLNHTNSKIDNSFRVWVFYCFQKWYKNNYE